MTVEAALGSSIEGLHQMAERLGLLDRLKSKLMRQPQAALGQLRTVLFEMDKVFTNLSSRIDDYASLSLVPPGEQISGVSRAKAVEIWQRDCMKLRWYAAGDHQTSMRHAHGDCLKISWIYATYLSPWFAEVLQKEESEELRRLFREMAESDSYMVDALVGAADWLQREAERTLDLVRAEDYEGAQRRVDAVWDQWDPVVRDLHKSSRRLWDLQTEFVRSKNPLQG